MTDFWPSVGPRTVGLDAQGGLVPTDAWWQRLLDRPELALVAESCRAEQRLHAALHAEPQRTVAERELQGLADADVRDNYRAFLAFRDALRSAGTIEACYVRLFRETAVGLAPGFVDLMCQALVRRLLDGTDSALEARAGEMLFRAQRITTQDGQVLAGDRATLDLLNETAGFGELGRLLAQAGAAPKALPMKVLARDNEAEYWAAGERFNFLLDLRHEATRDLGHGVQFTLARARSGLKALSRVLEKWVAHLVGVQVSITPEQRIDDPQWRWHVGLDVESTALLNDLYLDHPVDEDRLQRVISLFRLEFADPAQMRPDVAGRPVYLGLCMNAEGVVRLKPQNLLRNLPLARPA